MAKLEIRLLHQPTRPAPPVVAYAYALAESKTGLLKTELIKRRGPWRTCGQVRSPPWNTATGTASDKDWSRRSTDRVCFFENLTGRLGTGQH